LTIRYAWRGAATNAELNALHAEAFETRLRDDDWWGQIEGYSLGWVTARDAEAGDAFVGFVNVAWDGGIHAFILDTAVTLTHRGRGVGTELVRIATDEARRARCEWLHVDFEPHLEHFYFEECGFTSTPAGTIPL
jgi:GNAT superfamily N-acetyltransferase